MVPFQPFDVEIKKEVNVSPSGNADKEKKIGKKQVENIHMDINDIRNVEDIEGTEIESKHK